MPSTSPAPVPGFDGAGPSAEPRGGRRRWAYVAGAALLLPEARNLSLD